MPPIVKAVVAVVDVHVTRATLPYTQVIGIGADPLTGATAQSVCEFEYAPYWADSTRPTANAPLVMVIDALSLPFEVVVP